MKSDLAYLFHDYKVTYYGVMCVSACLCLYFGHVARVYCPFWQPALCNKFLSFSVSVTGWTLVTTMDYNHSSRLRTYYSVIMSVYSCFKQCTRCS